MKLKKLSLLTVFLILGSCASMSTKVVKKDSQSKNRAYLSGMYQ